jgi:hypothetical protein
MDELTSVTVDELFRDLADQLNLQWIAGLNGGNRILSSETVQKPTLALIGHLNFVHPEPGSGARLRRDDFFAGTDANRPQRGDRSPVFYRTGRHRRIER